MMLQDPNLLLSFINTKLRDYYSCIDDLCDDLNYDKKEIDAILNKAGYFYHEKTNQYQ